MSDKLKNLSTNCCKLNPNIKHNHFFKSVFALFIITGVGSVFMIWIVRVRSPLCNHGGPCFLAYYNRKLLVRQFPKINLNYENKGPF